jgi:hypothetical protein
MEQMILNLNIDVLSTSESHQATGKNTTLPPFYLTGLSGNRKKKFQQIQSRIELHSIAYLKSNG